MGCKDNYTPVPQSSPENQPQFILSNDLYVSEEIDGGLTKTTFTTNDTKYLSYEGMTMWTVWGEDVINFSSRTVKMAKSEGYSGGGYGIVFCHDEYEVEGNNKHAMLIVMINNDGQYIIGKAVGGVFTDFGWWKSTPHLKKGLGISNELKVIYEEDKYCLIINGEEVERFRDDEEPCLRNGKNGYIVVITPFDNFPASRVNVYFFEER